MLAPDINTLMLLIVSLPGHPMTSDELRGGDVVLREFATSSLDSTPGTTSSPDSTRKRGLFR
jgi:hypothetical protein